MVEARSKKNALHELGYKIFLDRYAQKDMKRQTLAMGDTVIVVVDPETGQREIGTVTALDLPHVSVKLLDGTVVERDLENVDKPVETDPSQMMDRVAAGVATVEATPELQQRWAAQFRWALDDWKFVPAGRILAAAGTDQELTYYNCMPPEQEILTAEGYKPIADVRVGEAVVTHRNRLRPVLHKFERETEEELYIIRPKKLGFDDLRVTGDHKVYVIRSEWVNRHKSRDGLRLKHEPDWIPARQLKAGDFVAVAYNSEECPPDVLFLSDYVDGYETDNGKLFKSTTRGDHGRVKAWGTHFDLNDRVEIDGELCYLFGRWLGDGCVTHRSGTDIPSGIKIVFGLDEKDEAEEIARIIEDKFGLVPSVKLSSTGRWYDLWANSLPLGQFFKALLGHYSHGKRIPDLLMHLPQPLTLELLRGLFSADGYTSGKYLGILLSNHTLSVQVHQLLLRLGYLFSIKENTHRLGRTPAYRLTATVSECAPLFDYFFGKPAPEVGTVTKYYFEYDDLRWLRIDEIATESYTGTVMDIEVAEDHSFVSAGVVVSNCYVIPSPSDSRGGIIETLRQMTEIMSRGGGVGINVSSLRPRSAYVKGVNGRSSGAVSWGALYSFVTGLIEQGGCFGPNERILTDKGLIPAAELADRMDAGEVFYAHTHKGLRQITYRFRNGVKPLYEVTTKRGYKVRITEDHKVAVLMDGQITTMPLKYLQPGDEILLLLEQEVVETVGAPASTDAYRTSPDAIASIVPVGESDVYDFEVDEVHLLSANNIYTSNSRRGALMLILNDTHPDIFEFINSKRKAGQITNANISVGVSDRLMEAVRADADWDLVFPDTSYPDYDEVWDGDLEKWEASGRRVLHYRTVKARDLWNTIIKSAWASAEPGVWFRDRYNKMSNSAYYPEGNIICTNPCVTGDTLVSTEHGYTKARDLQVGMKIRTPAGLKPIEKIYNNGVQRIYRVEFSDGGFVEGTADHKLKVVRDKKYEWVAISDLAEGDKVLVSPNQSFGVRRRLPEAAIAYIEKRQLNVSEYFDRTLGFLVGVVLGDGTLRKLPNGNSHSYQCKVAFGANEPEWLEHVTNLLAEVGIHSHLRRSTKEFAYETGDVVVHQSLALECYKLATLLAKLGMPTNVKAPYKALPEEFMSLDKDFLAGVLDGLFSTDGSVLMKRDNPMLRFHTSSVELAQQVRLLLLQFGIHGRIYSQERDVDLEYDGRSMYGTGVKYDVIVMNEGVPQFYSEVGLSHSQKAERLKEIAENWHYYGGSWLAAVTSVSDTGREEEVYDVYEPYTITWVTNGYVSLDCGEQGLPANGVCNLGAINLAAFYDAEKHDVNWEDLDKTARIATRFLDNVIDTTPYFFEANRTQQLNERRVGLNTMGIAELMVKLGIRYGSDESVAFIDRLYSFVVRAIYETSIELAQEKGPFPKCEPEKFIQSGFMQTMPEDIREKVRQHGIRNVTLTTQAPNGTIGTMVNTSTGIEPFFSWTYYRKSRLGLHEEKVPIVQQWLDEHPGETELPDYFITAMDLSPEEHIKVQAAIQRWVDSSISKTCNVPNEYTVEQVSDLYWYMYDLGCKGGTIYRDGSRDEQVLMLKGDERAEKEIAKKSENGHVAEPTVTQVSTPHHIYPRPTKLSGVTVRRKTPFGNAFITMNTDGDGNPFEVFITVGKAGSDLQADADGLARMISLALRSTAPQNRLKMLELVIDQLQNLGGARAVGLGPSRVSSLPDAVAGALQEHYFRHEAATQLNLPMNGDAHPAEPVSADGSVKGADMCPECGTYSLIRAEGCRTCLNCGYSEC